MFNMMKYRCARTNKYNENWATKYYYDLYVFMLR